MNLAYAQHVVYPKASNLVVPNELFAKPFSQTKLHLRLHIGCSIAQLTSMS